MAKKFFNTMLLTLVMLVFCSCGSIDNSTSVDTNYDTPEPHLTESEVEGTNVLLVENVGTNTEQDENDENVSPKISEEVLSLEERMDTLCQAYFEGDTDAIKVFLTDNYSWDIDVYDNPEHADEVEIIGINGLNSINELDASDEYILSLSFINPGEDTLTYLTVEFVNENGSWKVSHYGLEK